MLETREEEEESTKSSILPLMWVGERGQKIELTRERELVWIKLRRGVE